MLAGEKLVGVLVAEDRRAAGTFDDRTERILAAAASQIALVVDNLRAKEQARQSLAAAQQRAGDFEFLNQAAAAVSSSLRSGEVAGAALPANPAHIWVRPRSVWTREPGIRAAWRLVAAEGAQPATLNQSGGLEPSPAAADMAASRQTLAVFDTSVDSRFSGDARAWLGIPLVSQGEVIGLIELEKEPGRAL